MKKVQSCRVTLKPAEEIFGHFRGGFFCGGQFFSSPFLSSLAFLAQFVDHQDCAGAVTPVAALVVGVKFSYSREFVDEGRGGCNVLPTKLICIKEIKKKCLPEYFQQISSSSLVGKNRAHQK